MTPLELNQLYIVTWSKTHNDFHVETANIVCNRGKDILNGRTKIPWDWIIVGFETSHEKAHKLAKELREDKENFWDKQSQNDV